MLKPAKCPSCGGALQIPDNQTLYRCSYCSSEFFVENTVHTSAAAAAPTSAQSPTPPPTTVAPAAEPEACVKVDFAGAWVAIDADVKVFFDNQLIGVGSVKKGFSFVFDARAYSK